MSSVSSEVLSVDPYMKNAFSSAVKFDISHKSGQSNALRRGRSHDVGEAEEMKETRAPQQWEVDVRPQVSTTKWLASYGLRKLRLHMDQILPAIGFKLQDDYDPSFKRPISSRYGQGLFNQVYGADGKTFNVTCSRDKLIQLKRRLTQALSLYRRRLDWLTSESRRIFGVVEEKAVTVVMDVRNMSPDQFDQYRSALVKVLKGQFQHLTKFNIIRASEDIELYSPECMPLSHDTLDSAIQWVMSLDRLAPVSNTAVAEAVIKAISDPHNEAVYLFTEGTSVDCCRELLLEKVNGVERKVPVHVVSFNCNSSDTIKFLRNFATVTGGRFHAYAVVMELDAYEALPMEPVTSKANIVLKRKTFGGIPPGAGVREDVVRLFEEMEEARTTLQQIDVLIQQSPEPNRALTESPASEKEDKPEKDEQYMSSQQWLEVYGLEARKLNLYDVLSGLAFKHKDGVVEILEKPSNKQTDAEASDKLINARYCDQFPVVRWKDGRVVHVQVTPEVHRNFEQRMQVALDCFQQRVDWLKQGSRALFGTVVEEEIYIVIDTSASMQHSIQFVKERLFVLMQEQLRHKSKVNLLAFNSKVVAWRDRLVEVSERSLQSAWTWVQDLTCWGSTNTQSALQTALADPHAQAVYLLSDGRPDQPPRTIIAQAQMAKRVPIHTISFNCNDHEANQFLYDLAQATEGRYHYFSENGSPLEEPDSWQSQDIKLLKDEMARGLEYLDQLADLRDQCTSMSWKKEVDLLKQCSKGHPTPQSPSRLSAVPPLDAKDIFRPQSPVRPTSAPPPAAGRTPALPSSAGHAPRPSSAAGHRPVKSLGSPRRPQSAKACVHHAARQSHKGRKLVAGHTRTSLLRTMSASGKFSPNEWLLPETSRLFDAQAERQRKLAEPAEQEARHRKKRQQLAKSYEASSKLWLKKNGLVASRLTILDALAPTLVPHRAKYIPILDKHVLSRVFDEVMPIAHVSGAGKNRVHLVNPNGVNLKDYEDKLEKALDKYRQRLNTLVWNALPDKIKEEFDMDQPASFSEHRGRFLQALSEQNWPVAENDIALLEKEIERGEKFLQQSRDLRRAAADAQSDALSDALSDTSAARALRRGSGHSTGQSVDKVVHVEDGNITTVPTTPRVGPLTPRPPDNPDTPRSSKGAPSTPRSTASIKDAANTSIASVALDNKSNTSINNVGRKYIGSAPPRLKNADRGDKKGRTMISTLRGTRVVARNDKDGLYYPGKVLRCPNVRHATVEFTYGQHEVLTRFIIPISGAVSCPPLQVGDYALVQVVNLEQGWECYVPSVVQFTPKRRQAQAQFYNVVLYNGQAVTTRRLHLVKISKERFELTARYIAAVQGEDRNKMDDKVYVSQNRKQSSPERAETQCSRSRSGARSSDGSVSPVERPRSPTPGHGLYESPSPPRSTPRPEMKVVGLTDDATLQNNEPGVRSRPQSKSPSRRSWSGSQRSDSGSRSRSRSPTAPLTDRQKELRKIKRQLKKKDKESRRWKKKVEKLKQQLKDKMETLQPEQTEEVEQPLETPRLLRLRRNLPVLQPVEEVIARFSDDGWYYRGTVQQYLNDLSYIVEDASGYMERIWREDIISDYDDNAQALAVADKVVAPHPSHSGSYAPGSVEQEDPDLQTVQVKFYDNQTATVPRTDVYRLPQEKYSHDVQHIHQRQREMLGLSVVTRDDNSGAYYPGQLIDVGAGKQEYVIRWTDGSQCEQLPIHIFSAITRRPRLVIGDRVLALADPNLVVFLPGQVIGSHDGALMVRFCDGQIRDDVSPIFCYWLSQGYYEEASYFWKICQPDFGRREY